MEQAAKHNAQFQTEGVPWIADDFMGTGDRQKRLIQHRKDERAVLSINQRLNKIKPGVKPKNLPKWATGGK